MLKHQNIKSNQVGSARGHVAQWLEHLVYIWGIQGDLGSNPGHHSSILIESIEVVTLCHGLCDVVNVNYDDL